MMTTGQSHHPRPKGRASWAIVLAALLAQSGCGYSLAGRGSFLPAYIHRIGLPQFVNQTPVFDVERKVTDRVRAEFLGRGKYTIVPETTGVDAVLTGTIASITIQPAAVNEQNLATRYLLTMTASVEFKDLKANKVLWANPSMQYREEFDVGSGNSPLDPATFLGQDTQALDRMTVEFARSVVSAILEAF